MACWSCLSRMRGGPTSSVGLGVTLLKVAQLSDGVEQGDEVGDEQHHRHHRSVLHCAAEALPAGVRAGTRPWGARAARS